MKGEQLYNELVKLSARVDEYLSRVISETYSDPVMICNPVTSRVPDATSLLLRINKQEFDIGRPLSKLQVLTRVIKFYFKNIGYLGVILVHGLVFRMSRLRFNSKAINPNKDLIVISTFTMIDRIYPISKFTDSYFGELYDVLKRKDVPYVIICILFGDKPYRLFRRLQTYNILAADGRNFISEYEILGFKDWLSLVIFILTYPLKTISLLKKEYGEFDSAFRSELLATLDVVQCHNYLRYLVGKRLGILTDKDLKIISWYENQVTDKLLFRGVRDQGIKSKIYGCQFFLKCPLYANLNPLPAEDEYGVLPDIIYTSGRPQGHPSLLDKIQPGISPRYNYLFQSNIPEGIDRDKGSLLVLLTYGLEESQKIIGLVERHHQLYPEKNIAVKLHPNHVLAQPFVIPENWQVVDASISELCRNVEMVVTSGSSSAMEAAIIGCSVVIVGNNDKVTINVMPDMGRGKIWDMVFDDDDIDRVVTPLLDYRQRNPHEVRELSIKYRELFLIEASEDKYVKLFDL